MSTTDIPAVPPPLSFRLPIDPFKREPVVTYPVANYADGARLFLLTTASRNRQTILFTALGWVDWDEQLGGWRHVPNDLMQARARRFVSETARSTGVAAEQWFDAAVTNPRPVHVRGFLAALKALAIWPKPTSAASVAPPADPRGPVRIASANA